MFLCDLKADLDGDLDGEDMETVLLVDLALDQKMTCTFWSKIVKR